MYHNRLEKMTFLSDKRQKFIRHPLVFSLSFSLSLSLVLIIYVDLLFYTHAHINDYCRFLVSPFSSACRRKAERREFPSLVDFSKDIKKREKDAMK